MTLAAGDIDRGAGLIKRHRCGACHELPASLTSELTSVPLPPNSTWDAGCLQSADAKSQRPGFGLSEKRRNALKTFVTTRQTNQISSQQLLAENNCLGCHARGETRGIATHQIDIIEEFPETASSLTTLSPPSLNSIGDKLNDRALLKTIRGEQKPLRDWLKVQMPKFNLSKGDATESPTSLLTATEYRVSEEVHKW